MKYVLAAFLLIYLIRDSSSIQVRGEQNIYGGTNFLEMITNNSLYVDKTMLIKRLLKHNETRFMIVRPPRWGKSLNLDMIRRFFELEVNTVTGVELPVDKKVNIKLFNSTNGLEISKETEIIRKHQGKHPVIHLNFGIIESLNYNSIKDSVVKAILSEYQRHKYLLRLLIGYLKTRKFRDFVNDPVTEFEWINVFDSVHFLSKMLSHVYQKPTIILVDNFDTPFTVAYERRHMYNADVIKHFEQNLHLLYEFLVGDKNAKFIIMTGVHPGVYKQYYFTDYPYTDSLFGGHKIEYRFCKYYGFTEEEVKALIQKTGKKHNIQDLSDWYGTYFCNEDDISKITTSCASGYEPCELFNPYSLLKFIENGGTYGSYWTKLNPVPIFNYISFENTAIDFVASLLPYKVKYYKKYNYFHVHFHSQTYDRFNSEMGAINYMTLNGLLVLSLNEFQPNSFYQLTIPNKEIKNFVETGILHALKKRVLSYSEYGLGKINFTLSEHFNMSLFMLQLRASMSKFIYHPYWYFNTKIYCLLLSTMFIPHLKNHYMTTRVEYKQEYGIVLVLPNFQTVNKTCFIMELRETQKGNSEQTGNDAVVHLKTHVIKRIAKNYRECGRFVLLGLAFSNNHVFGLLNEKILECRDILGQNE